MREFNRRSSPDTESRRNPLRDRAFGRADQGGGALRIVVCFQIHCDDQTKPRPPGCRPLHKHAALRKRSEHPGFLILFHMAPDLFCQLLLLRLSEVVFRQNHSQRGRGSADDSVRLLPVCRLGCILIAGNNRPLLIVRPFLWKLDPGNSESHLTECMHAVILHPMIFVISLAHAAFSCRLRAALCLMWGVSISPAATCMQACMMEDFWHCNHDIKKSVPSGPADRHSPKRRIPMSAYAAGLDAV